MPRETIETPAGSPEQVQAAAAILRAGGVILIPTETVYGLACRFDDAAARERIYRIKGRPDGKPLQLLISGLSQAEAIGVQADARFEALSDAYWPGGLTIVLPSADGSTTHGLRWPDHPFVTAVIEALGAPLAATSANPTGVEPAASAANDFADLAEQPDLIVTGHCGGGAASSVVALTGPEMVVLREGAIPAADLHAAIESAT